MLDLNSHVLELGSKYIYPYIIQIGVGGTGTYVAQNLAQLLGAGKIPHTYILADPDVIEEKNLKNQLFISEEVGLPKAEVLAERYNYAYDTNIHFKTDCYLEDASSIVELFDSVYVSGKTYDMELVPILIGCVDNNFTRQAMEKVMDKMPRLIYIDAGNESVNVPKDWSVRPQNLWTTDELENYKSSGWSGQVVTGYKWGSLEQPTVAKVFPDILDDTDSLRPSSLSCSEVSGSDPQRMIVNKTAALAITGVVQEIVDNKSVSKHITFFHALKGYMRTVPFEQPIEKEKKQPA